MALPMILLISGIVLEISVSLALITFYVVQNSANGKYSNQALSAAQAGIDDALMQLKRNNNFSNTNGYNLTVENSFATIVVCKDFLSTTYAPCSVSNPGEDEITSTGQSFGRSRKMRAIVDVSTSTGEIDVKSIQEISL